MKYFYTDPLAAAWMAKNFGMQFENHFKANWWEMEGFVEGFDKGDKVWIRHDSLHLLEPISGDLYTFTRPETDERFYFVMEETVARNNAFTVPEFKAEIIQRNGIAFMWPEGKKTMAEDGQ